MYCLSVQMKLVTRFQRDDRTKSVFANDLYQSAKNVIWHTHIFSFNLFRLAIGIAKPWSYISITGCFAHSWYTIISIFVVKHTSNMTLFRALKLRKYWKQLSHFVLNVTVKYANPLISFQRPSLDFHFPSHVSLPASKLVPKHRQTIWWRQNPKRSPAWSQIRIASVRNVIYQQSYENTALHK